MCRNFYTIWINTRFLLQWPKVKKKLSNWKVHLVIMSSSCDDDVIMTSWWCRDDVVMMKNFEIFMKLKNAYYNLVLVFICFIHSKIALNTTKNINNFLTTIFTFTNTNKTIKILKKLIKTKNVLFHLVLILTYFTHYKNSS